MKTVSYCLYFFKAPNCFFIKIEVLFIYTKIIINDLIISNLKKNVYFFYNRKKSKLSKKSSCKHSLEKFNHQRIVLQIAVVIKRHFPDLMEELSNLKDYRKRPHYEIEELLMAIIFMFLFQKESRNNYDNQSKKPTYKENIYKIFGLNTPDLDTSDRLVRQLDPKELNRIKQLLIAYLIRKKILDKYRCLGRYFNITIDGSGLFSSKKPPFEGCPSKTSKTGIKTYYCQILEAKIVCTNGFSFSIDSEFIINPTQEEFDKQDCEFKAFKRLATNLKSAFPRLPILITADGLYPNKTTFEICKENKWPFIFTFKEGCLKTVWKQAYLLKEAGKWQQEKDCVDFIGKKKSVRKYCFLNSLKYKNYTLNLIECREEIDTHSTKFVHITDINITSSNCNEISTQGRLRWNIENQGFNTQKNQGYNLKHKYSRTSFNALQCYYQCLQIAHMINQLVFKSELLSKVLKEKETIKSVVESINAILSFCEFNQTLISNALENIRQISYT